MSSSPCWRTATSAAGPVSKRWCCAPGPTCARSRSSMTSSTRPGRSLRPCGGWPPRAVGAEARREAPA
eukprot:3340437-Lingulodinium_polyedra.AAC.1